MRDQNQQIVLWGASGHALVVGDIVRSQNALTVVGLIDDVNPGRSGELFHGYRVLGGREILPELLSQGVRCAGVAVGDCRARGRLADYLDELGFERPALIHAGAVVAPDASVGAGTVVAAGAVINPCARIGSNVIVNTCASVDHECVVGDSSTISPGVHIGGAVCVGARTCIGIGASVRDKVKIGCGAVVGAGALVINDIPDNVVAYGVPARVMRTYEE